MMSETFCQKCLWKIGHGLHDVIWSSPSFSPLTNIWQFANVKLSCQCEWQVISSSIKQMRFNVSFFFFIPCKRGKNVILHTIMDDPS